MGIQRSEGEPTCACSLFTFQKQKISPVLDPPYFFLFPSAALELFFILPSEKYSGVGEVTQTPCSQPRPLPSWDSSRFSLVSHW